MKASILAHLPLTLRQLGVREDGDLHDGLKLAMRAQRRREQDSNNETIAAERQALDHMAKLVEDPTDLARRCFLLDRVRRKMSESGYGADSVLLELVQNADDAIAQAAEIAGAAGGELPDSVRRVVVRVHESEGEPPTIDLKHYGRPINETGGATFPAARDREWDQDLYFMMVMNLSGKPGETAEDPTATTTGVFGLGFKSVHLISDMPSVVSGFIAFSIACGLLPQGQVQPVDPDLAPIDGHPVTRIRLPLRSDDDAPRLADIFRRFHITCPLIPAFAREIREVIVDGCAYSGTSEFDSQPIAKAPGWSVSNRTVDLPGHSEGRRLLRFQSGTESLVVGLRDGIPVPLHPNLPFIWNVMPTNECWGCGYAISGPFKLDHGRTHVSLDHPTTIEAIDRLGCALGQGLEDLHDALGEPTCLATGLSTGADGIEKFVTELWTVLASGIGDRDELRRKFLLRLHGNGRGISAWMTARSVVPSGLSTPFNGHLPPLAGDITIEQAAGGLDDPVLCAALSKIDGTARDHVVVTGHIAQLLRPLVDLRIPCSILSRCLRSLLVHGATS